MSNPISAEKIVYIHKNPIKETASFGKKLFIPEKTENEVQNVDKALDTLKNILSEERVEKKSARAVAEWLPELNRAKIIKRIGHVTQFGYKQGPDFYLAPEEALFLMEMNRLELLCHEIPFSIEQAYTTLLGNGNCSIKQYRVYQTLAKQGYHLKNSDETEKNNSNEEITPKKIKLDESLSKKESNCYNIYSSEQSNKKLTHKLTLQSNHDPLNNENISTRNIPVLSSFSGFDSVAFYQVQAIDFDNK